MIASPGDPDVVAQVALVKAFTGKKREGAFLLFEAAKLAGYQPASRVNNAVAALLDVGELYPAIDLLENSLLANPDDDKQRRTLVGFLAEAQRTKELQPHLKTLIQRRSFDFPLLISVTDTSTRRLSERTSSLIMERNPDDHRIRMADAFLSMYRHDPERAIGQLKDIIHHHPDFAPAHAMLGQALSASSRWGEIMDWLESCPKGCKTYADYWLTIGDYAYEQKQYAGAIRAYWEASQIDPNRLPAWDKLRLAILRVQNGSQELDSVQELDAPIGQDELKTITDHAERLILLRDRFNQYTARDPERQTDAIAVAQSLYELGRVWEAEAWSAAATTIQNAPSDQLKPLREKIVAKLQQRPEWVAKDLAALRLDFSALPTPNFKQAPSVSNTRTDHLAVASTSHYRMTESSTAVGIGGRWSEE